MKRREFITLLGGVAAWPFPGQAQQPTMPMVGYLDFYAAEPTGIFLTAFRNGLSEAGYTEGHNVAIEYRYANTDTEMPNFPFEAMTANMPSAGAGLSASARNAPRAYSRRHPFR
jgi:putative ABC transport system substrate-binding protein